MAEHENPLYAAIAGQVEQLHGVQVGDDVIETMLSTITRGAVAAIPGAARAAICLVDNGEVVSLAGTDSIAGRLDELQAKHDAGPCLDAAWCQRHVHVSDYGFDRRWPAYIPDVLALTPVRSTIAVQLYRTENSMAALNIHADHPRTFDTTAIVTASAFATQAALALHAEARETQFRTALASRDIIGQAKGIIMKEFAVDADGAFDLLRRMSQETNVRLVDLARRLVELDIPSTPTP
ncbi:MAG: GAF and ANTAR domain-containing protein [Gordonia polyisoprenivorans]|nr:GAF and ANTAR domain-containing protein [Gordonia polyisoprenivorans]